MADGSNTGSGWGWFWLIVVVALLGGTYLYQREGGRIFGPDSEQERVRKSVERVLAADSTTSAGATSVEQVVNRMRAIDTTGCPNDFRAAYLAHIHAWELMADVEKDAIALKANSESGATLVESFIRGFLGDPFGKANEIQAAQTQLQRNYQAANQQIKSTSITWRKSRFFTEPTCRPGCRSWLSCDIRKATLALSTSSQHSREKSG